MPSKKTVRTGDEGKAVRRGGAGGFAVRARNLPDALIEVTKRHEHITVREPGLEIWTSL
jgi:hypothetical protein